MMFKSTKEILIRLKNLEEENASLRRSNIDLDLRIYGLTDQVASYQSANLALEEHLNDKHHYYLKLEEQLSKRIDRLEMTQCASYEGAMERLKAMIAFESQQKLLHEVPTVINLR